MKRIVVILVTLMISVVAANAKVVRGYVSDQNGKPVVGMKMVAMNADKNKTEDVVVTDKEGYFAFQVPDNVDTDDLREIFAKKGTKIISIRTTATGSLDIIIEQNRNDETFLAQK